MNWISAAQITTFGCLGASSVKVYGWFFLSSPAINQIPRRLQALDPALAFCIETPHPASKDPSASVSYELRQDPGSG